MKNSVLCRNLTEPTILAGFDFLPDRSPAAVVAVEMWEPAFCAGFQAPGTTEKKEKNMLCSRGVSKRARREGLLEWK